MYVLYDQTPITWGAGGERKLRFIWARKHDEILIGCWYTQCRLPRDLAGFKPVTICFQHRFKIPREFEGFELSWSMLAGEAPSLMLRSTSNCQGWSTKNIKGACWKHPNKKMVAHSPGISPLQTKLRYATGSLTYYWGGTSGKCNLHFSGLGN